KPTAMRFDDRPADRESHADSVRLRREERIENFIEGFWSDAGAAVFDRYKEFVRSLLARPDHYFFPWSRPFAERVHCVHHQIQNYLLKLNPVRLDFRHGRGQLSTNRNAAAAGFVTKEFNQLLNHLININPV